MLILRSECSQRSFASEEEFVMFPVPMIYGQKQPPKVLYKEGCFLKKFCNIHTKTQLSWSLFLIKLHARRPEGWCFPVSIAKFLRTPILKNISERLLLFDKNIQLNFLDLINYQIMKHHNNQFELKRLIAVQLKI